MDPVIIGIGGPVGAGKTQLVERLTRAMSEEISMAAITNDIYTIEDAKILSRTSVLPEERIVGIETGGCPHTAIREDTSMNEAAIEQLKARFPDLQVIFVESGGDNLTATFSPALADAQLFVLDVAGGGDVARKGGPGIARADLLVINKTDLAPHVGVDVAQMCEDAASARGSRPVVALSRHDPVAVGVLAAWIRATLATYRAGAHVAADPGPMAPHSHGEDTGPRDHAHAH